MWMAGISGGRYKDFLLQEIMVLGLERRWSAVDTCNKEDKNKTFRKLDALKVPVIVNMRLCQPCHPPGRC